MNDTKYRPGARQATGPAEWIHSTFGQAADDHRDTDINEGVDVYYFMPAPHHAFVPGRFDRHFGWGTLSYSIDSACASSPSAVLLVCSAL
ncbi:beta-ketoacyl synthase [Colletotrichum costaricense]|uniref:Beta-ketoacyl synthase n=1 Tax=Colletotrichum costaricense TaxID=1209916 RepID=A0AAI9YLN5_9PEZI|nr:beta-ketoacyl synthase [Colletotrichum costaricense]KAK1515084.1 beta-ketoacyl synthase [Colletotrichum costaricense]